MSLLTVNCHLLLLSRQLSLRAPALTVVVFKAPGSATKVPNSKKMLQEKHRKGLMGPQGSSEWIRDIDKGHPQSFGKATGVQLNECQRQA